MTKKLRTKDLITRCTNTHVFCGQINSCPYCEPIKPLRYTDGTFANASDLYAANKKDK